MIPYEDFLRYQQLQESEVLANFDQVWDRLSEANAQLNAKEITGDIANLRRNY